MVSVKGSKHMKQRTVYIVLAAGLLLIAVGLASSGFVTERTSAQGGEPTPSPELEEALERARVFAGDNADWEPFVWELDGVEMVLVPAGCFMMGSTEEQIDAALALCNEELGDCRRAWFENESPLHEVCFEEPFWIDKTEVSRAMYAEYAADTLEPNEYSSRDAQPVNFITWFGAQTFCDWRNARLPTEAEWEYAARGPESLIYSWGNEFVGDHVVYKGNSNGETVDVGSRLGGTSWVGALDMSGNVLEWVMDWYDPEYYSFVRADSTPTGPETGEKRVLRGGSYGSDNSYLRTARRQWNSPDSVYSPAYGIRCARSAED